MSDKAPSSPVVSKQRWEPQVLTEKRKRFVPPSQAKLNEWSVVEVVVLLGPLKSCLTMGAARQK